MLLKDPIVSLSNVSFQYAGRTQQVFREFSLDIQPGTLTAILGPNGSGKTTLLHLILGYIQPTDGVVLLGRRPREQYSRRAIGKLIGLVSQDEYIPFNFTVMEYVLLGRAPHLQILQTPSAHDVQLACDVLEHLEIRALAHAPLQSLSGGERQLTMIARTMVQQPSILLLDEPTSHLDLGNSNRVLTLLRNLVKQNATVIFTTQNPGAALSVAEYSVLMREGDILAAGMTIEVMTAANLTATYGVPVEVYEVAGRRIVVDPTISDEPAP